MPDDPSFSSRAGGNPAGPNYLETLMLTGRSRKFLRRCNQCGDEFFGKGRGAYCSQSCKSRRARTVHNSRRPPKKVTLKSCPSCGTKFIVWKGKKFCSKRCRNRYWVHKNKDRRRSIQKKYDQSIRGKQTSTSWRSKNRDRHKRNRQLWYLNHVKIPCDVLKTFGVQVTTRDAKYARKYLQTVLGELS